MAHYIVRYTKPTAVPELEVARAKKFPGVQVVDESTRMLLIDTTADIAKALDQSLPDWSVSEERTYAVPDPRPRIINKIS